MAAAVRPRRGDAMKYYWLEYVKPAFLKLNDKLVEKLGKKAYRDVYIDKQVRVWISRQIRVLREQRGWSQTEFARICGKPQSVISRLEDPDYGKVSLQTLLDIRSAFDVGLQVRFVDFGTAICSTRDVSAGGMSVDAYSPSQLKNRHLNAQTASPVPLRIHIDMALQNAWRSPFPGGRQNCIFFNMDTPALPMAENRQTTKTGTDLTPQVGSTAMQLTQAIH